MPPEASGPVFTVRKPIFIGPLWARRIVGAATSALAPSMPFKTVRRWTVMAPPFGFRLMGTGFSRRLLSHQTAYHPYIPEPILSRRSRPVGGAQAINFL